MELIANWIGLTLVTAGLVAVFVFLLQIKVEMRRHHLRKGEELEQIRFQLSELRGKLAISQQAQAVANRNESATSTIRWKESPAETPIPVGVKSAGLALEILPAGAAAPAQKQTPEPEPDRALPKSHQEFLERLGKTTKPTPGLGSFGNSSHLAY